MKLDNPTSYLAARHLPGITHVVLQYSRTVVDEVPVMPSSRQMVLEGWPTDKLALLCRGWRLDRLEFAHMRLDDLYQLKFAEDLSELCIRACHLGSLAGIKHWIGRMKHLTVVETMVPDKLAKRLTRGIPGLSLTFEPLVQRAGGRATKPDNYDPLSF